MATKQYRIEVGMKCYNWIDLAGCKFGRWTAQHYVGKGQWRCICDCGTTANVRADELRSGCSRSCRCVQRERAARIAARANLTRGCLEMRRLYKVWVGMKARCFYKGHIGFARYGGRGISVCDRWRKSFEAFVQDMGARPPGHSVDRIDNDGDYTPSNCRWATRKEQGRNSSSNVRLEYAGLKLTAPEWAERTGISEDAIKHRLRAGWTVERALTAPRRRCKKPSRGKYAKAAAP